MTNLNNYSTLEKEIRMGMNLIERDEFTATIQAISHIAAETVGKTLGPFAHTTIIDDGNFTYPTKDGWSVLQRFRFQDPTHQSIFNMLKNISFRIVDKVGDGTTTAMVTADHFMTRLNEAMTTGLTMQHYRQVEIVDALNRVRDLIIKDLKKSAIQITPDPADPHPQYDEIYDVAYISSNGNSDLADIMQKIYQETGNPNILIDMDGGPNLSYEIQRGYRLDCQFLMHERYVNTSEKYYDGLNNPHLVAIFDHSVSYQKHAELIQFMLESSRRMGMPLILMAPYFDDVISAQFSVIVQDHLKKNPGSIPGLMIVQIPEMTRATTVNNVKDFAALAPVAITDASKVKIFNEMRHNENSNDETDIINDPAMQVPGYNFTTAQELLDSCLGVVTGITLGKNFCTLHNLRTDSTLYKERYAKAKEDYEQAMKDAANSPTSYTKALLDATQRLNKLSGAMGVIHVGGLTDLERQCNRDFVDDTFLACRSAFENGVVSGLNLGALASMIHVRENVHLSDLEACALNVLYQAYVDTTLDIMANKDPNHKWPLEDDRVYPAEEAVWALANYVAEHPNASYDIVTEQITDEKVPVVCNSVSTDIEILYGITSILGMTLTSNQYMSVSRMYDKTAAIRQQEALNERSTSKTVETVLNAVNDWLRDHDRSALLRALCTLTTPAN